MQAIVLHSYGGPEVLQSASMPTPKLPPDSVLVQVRAAAVNPVDYKIRLGYLDPAFPSAFPMIPGWDMAGVVEAVGPAVGEYGPGDEVVGYVRKDWIQEGTYAELVSAPVRTLAPKPASLDFVRAAGLPLAGLTAYQALTATGLDLHADEAVLIHAATGGVGSFAVQLARWMGARVIGTASPRNHDYLRSLGAEPLAYGEELVEECRALLPEGPDAVLDLVGGQALEDSRVLLRPGGRLASVVDAARVMQLDGRYVFVRPDAQQLAHLGRLVDQGLLRVEVAAVLALGEAAEAQRMVETGHVRGKVILQVSA